MTEHLTEQQLESFRRRKMSPEGLLTAHQHIAVCESCRQQLSAPVQVELASAAFERELLQTDAVDEHLLYQELSGYVDDELGGIEREIVESHLETCAECAAEVRDLRAFKSTIAARENETIQSPLPTSWWHWQPGWNPVRTLMVAGSIILVLTAIFLLWAKLSHRDQARIAHSPNTNGEATPQSSPVSPSPDNNNLVRPPDETEQQQAGNRKIEGEPSPQAQIIVALKDGNTLITLDSRGRISGVAAGSPDMQRLLSDALGSQHLEKPPALDRLIRGASVQLGDSQENLSASLIRPVGTVVENVRPVFTWKSLEGASGYTVSIFDAGLNEVARSERLNTTSWKSSRTLRRGAIYRWQVIAFKDGREIVLPPPTAPEAKFKVLESQPAQTLSRERKRYADSHLALGLLYARLGLLDEAEAEMQSLVKENPDSETAKKLLQSLQAWRPAQHTLPK